MARWLRIAACMLALGACSGDAIGPDSGTDASGAGRIVFRSRDVHGSIDLAAVYAINPDGTGLTLLRDSVPSGSTSASALSPDGRKLAIGSPGAGINWFDLDSTVLHHVASTKLVGIVSWTDDSRTILFDDENGARIGRVNIDDSGLQILVDGLYPSSAGDLITYQRSGRVWIANVDGTYVAQLENADSGNSEGGPPQMAADGHRIAMTRTVLLFSGDTLIQSNVGLFVYDLNSRALNRLTPLPPAGQTIPAVSAPAWSPAGDRIVFARGGAWFVINADGTREHQIIPNTLGVAKVPAWSPHGSSLAFNAHDEVYVVNADGSGLHALTNTPNTIEFGVWWSAH